MFYFKFTDNAGVEMYGTINANKEQIDLEKLKKLLYAEALEEVSKEEYESETE